MPPTWPDKALLDSMRIYYQPIIRLEDGSACNAEVLARRADDDGTILGPQAIVDAMTGAERALLLTTAIMARGLAEYREHGFASHGLTLAFNLPLNAMLHPELVQRIGETRAASGLRPEAISFELTEDQPVRDLAAARAGIMALREAGYGLALDDITPGMTNLSALMQMPIRAIKLDRSIVTSPSLDSRDFIRAMSHCATAQAKHVIAEGIETPAQRISMHASGVTHGQGFLFSRPIPAQELSEFLKKH